LGAEIAELPFQTQFQGKKIMSNEGQFVSVNVVKKTDKVSYGNEHRVDAISGGTITSRGTNDMIKNCTIPYLAYFEKIKK
jgi:Na+-transporting NADH:ubiquinone oxidoreductase subunit C